MTVKTGLFDVQVARKPNKYPWTQDIIHALWHVFWTPEEFDFRSDYGQFHSDLTELEQGVIVRTLSAIGQVEVSVKRFWADLGKNLPHPYISDMGMVMAQNEVIHSNAYEKLLDILQLEDAFDNLLKEPVMAGRVKYLRKYLEKVYEDDREQFVYALVLFTLFVENTSLFGLFYTILNFNKYKNVLKDTAQQIAYTKFEEEIHSKVGITLINTLRKEYPELFSEDLNIRIHQACVEAVGYERAIMEWVLQGYEAKNLNSDIVMAYMTKRLSEAMQEAGFEGVPYDEELVKQTVWMDEVVKGVTYADFFATTPTEYTRNNRSYNPEELW